MYDLADNGYQIIFMQNDKSDEESMQMILNKRYATLIVDMIEDRISEIF